MTEPESNARYVEPTWRGRLLLLLTFVALAGFAYSHRFWLPPLLARLDTCNPCASLTEFRILAGYFFVMSLVPSAWLSWQAWRHWRVGQVPHPDAWLMFRVPVLTGVWHKLNIVCAVALAAVSLVAPVWVWTELAPWVWFFDSGC